MSSSEHAFCLQEQSMISPPTYEEATSPSARPLDANQTTDRLPTSYSVHIPSPWWEEDALTFCRTEPDFTLLVPVIQFIPLQDRRIIITILAGRPGGWLDTFLNILCRDRAIEEPRCDSPLSTAEVIVTIIRWRPSLNLPIWNGDWFFSDLFSSSILTIATKLDYRIHLAFCIPTFPDWIAWRCGYRCDIISEFLDALRNFRNNLVQLAQEYMTMFDRLLSLLEALPSQQPLLRWVVSTAISFDTSSDPSEALRYFLDPIGQQFDKRCSSIVSTSQKLSILDTRFRLKIVDEPDLKWPIPFSVDFSVWESTQNITPQELAKSMTESVSRLFKSISLEDIPNGRFLKDIGRMWSELVDDVLACLIVDKELTSYFMRLAEFFIHLGNVHFATAIGLALAQKKFQPREPSRVWDIINPKNHFAGCRKYMDEKPFCIPPMFLFVAEVKGSGNAPDKILEIFHRLVYFGIKQETEVGRMQRGGESKLERGQESPSTRFFLGRVLYYLCISRR